MGLFKKKEDKYIAKFCVKRGGSFEVVKSTEFDPGVDKLSFQEGSYPLDTEKYTVRKRNEFHYYIDVNAGQLSFEKISDQYHPKVYEWMERGVVKSLAESLMKKPAKYDWIALCIGAVIGVLSGILIGSYLL